MSSLRSEGGRFVLAGAFITVLYLAVVTGLRLLDAPWPLAIGAGYVIATSTHFVLHRNFVFAREQGFQLTLAQQLPRFIGVVVVQYVVTTTAMTILPGTLPVFFAVAACVTVASFLVLRTRLFH